uniref:Uncharacterized protein n=1 Tax=Setaria digitata TaxID=48799 RepID=A0A915PX91_9BILA
MSEGSESNSEVHIPHKIGLKDKIEADPGFPTTIISTVVSFTLSNLFFYGVTGNPRIGMLAGLISIPFCAITNILDTEQDYKAWKETEGMRARGVPEILISKKVKYDWEYYEPLRKKIEQYYNHNAEDKQNSN